ncbi:MAG TPA: quinol:electron acceptor oxidoreductase subunit ActD [Anaerolineales bacterium]
MKNLIGGLFETQESANQAYEALQNSGFADEQIHMFIHKPRNKTARSVEIQVQDVAKNAFIGGLIVAALGGLIGFLAGAGILPGTIPHEPLIVFAYTLGGAIVGGLIGAILGAASRLLRSREKAEVMTRQIEKKGVLLTAHVDDPQSESKARRVLEEHNALEVGNPAEKWDPDVWVSPNENTPSLADIR